MHTAISLGMNALSHQPLYAKTSSASQAKRFPCVNDTIFRYNAQQHVNEVVYPADVLHHSVLLLKNWAYLTVQTMQVHAAAVTTSMFSVTCYHCTLYRKWCLALAACLYQTNLTQNYTDKHATSACTLAFAIAPDQVKVWLTLQANLQLVLASIQEEPLEPKFTCCTARDCNTCQVWLSIYIAKHLIMKLQLIIPDITSTQNPVCCQMTYAVSCFKQKSHLHPGCESDCATHAATQ